MKNIISSIINEVLNKLKIIEQNTTITLYHGSGYYFSSFDISKINTGQHSQDFGYGLYFTDNKNTAKTYSHELSKTLTPIEKYNEIIVNNKKDEILYDYLKENRIISAKRILQNLIDEKVGDVDEWTKLLSYLNKDIRYGYVYTVKVHNYNFINKSDYINLKYQYNINSDKDMNKILLQMGYNGIEYQIKEFNSSNKGTETNVVIFDDSVIQITNIEKLFFDKPMFINNIR
jgi:hypothetical protein